MIKITIKGIAYTPDEARDIFIELSKLFPADPVYVPYQPREQGRPEFTIDSETNLFDTEG